MTIAEQYEKETGRYAESYVPGESYTDSYVEWLEEKLTWKKLIEQEPGVGSNIVVKSKNTNLNAYQNITIGLIKAYKSLPECEWMYVPE